MKGTSGFIRRRRPGGVSRQETLDRFPQRLEVRKPVISSPVTSIISTEDSDKPELRPRSSPFFDNGGWKPVVYGP